MSQSYQPAFEPQSSQSAADQERDEATELADQDKARALSHTMIDQELGASEAQSDVVAGNPYAGQMLRYGSSGAAVEYLQGRLNAHAGAGLAVDGVFGALTRAAVVKYQMSAQLSADGIVGPQTWGALGAGPVAKGDKKPDETEAPPTGDKEQPPDTTETPPVGSKAQPPDTGQFDEIYQQLTDPQLAATSLGPLLAQLAAAMGAPPALAGPAQQFSDQSEQFPPEYRAAEFSKAVASVSSSLIAFQTAVYPTGPGVRFQGPPQSIEEAHMRLRSQLTGDDKLLHPDETKYIYHYMKVMGLGAAMSAWQGAAAADQQLDPIRASIVSVALGQIGLVEARLSSGQTEPVGGSEVTLRKGAHRLLEYISMAAPDHASTEQQRRDILDVKVPIGKAGGNRVPSWCGIFALWVQNTAGNDGGVWPGPWVGPVIGPGKLQFRAANEEPLPGDVAYMHADQHHGTVVEVKGDTVITLEGNVGMISGIMMRSRSKGEWAGFARAVPREQEQANKGD
jgi:peptidoglycan hydrolase-like protein with peptidoglycan-binding domain